MVVVVVVVPEQNFCGKMVTDFYMYLMAECSFCHLTNSVE